MSAALLYVELLIPICKWSYYIRRAFQLSAENASKPQTRMTGGCHLSYCESGLTDAMDSISCALLSQMLQHASTSRRASSCFANDFRKIAAFGNLARRMHFNWYTNDLENEQQVGKEVTAREKDRGSHSAGSSARCRRRRLCTEWEQHGPDPRLRTGVVPVRNWPSRSRAGYTDACPRDRNDVRRYLRLFSLVGCKRGAWRLLEKGRQTRLPEIPRCGKRTRKYYIRKEVDK